MWRFSFQEERKSKVSPFRDAAEAMLTVREGHMGEPPGFIAALRRGCAGAVLFEDAGPIRRSGWGEGAWLGLRSQPTAAPRLVIGIYNLFEGWRYKWKQMCVFYG